jgi:hypothetical protein
MRNASLVVLAVALSSSPSSCLAGGWFDGCIGDCNGDGEVDVAEIIVGVRIALAEVPWSTCPNHEPADGNGAVNGLTTAVRLALFGCRVERDYSAFTRFAYSSGSALGFCPSDGLFSAAIAPRGGSHWLLRAQLVAGEPGVDACLPGVFNALGEDHDCPALRADADRPLTATELAAVRAHFAHVPINNSPAPACTMGYFDPCLVRGLRWDDRGAADFPCAAPRLAARQLTETAALIESLAAEPAPVGDCGNGRLDLGEACDFAIAGNELACARNCTIASARTCRLDPDRSRLRLDLGDGPPVDVAVNGTQTFAVGAPRSDALAGGAAFFRPHAVPIVVPHWALGFDRFAAGDRCICLGSAPSPAALDAVGVGTVDCDDVSNSLGAGHIGYRLAVAVLHDGGRCAPGARDQQGACTVADYGADCLPCTEDDPTRLIAGIGLSTATVYADEPPVDESGMAFDCDGLIGGSGDVSGVEMVGVVRLPGGRGGSLRLACQ